VEPAGEEKDDGPPNLAIDVAKNEVVGYEEKGMRYKLNEYLLGNVPHMTAILSCVRIVYGVHLNCPVL
jgi:hypothetical protein